jgi:integrase
MITGRHPRLQRGEIPVKPRDPFFLRDVATILIDCGIRPEECFRLQWEHCQNDTIEITYGKTDSARRRTPLSQRVQSILAMRRTQAVGPWIFPAPNKSGHIEPWSIRGQHTEACEIRKGRTLPDLHLSPHVSDALGALHGSLASRWKSPSGSEWASFGHSPIVSADLQIANLPVSN